MRNAIIIVLSLTLVGAAVLEAQQQPAAAPPRNFFTVYGTMFTNMSDFDDPGSNSRWELQDNAMGVGVAYQREFAQALLLGVDVAGVKADFRRVTLAAPIDTVDGDGNIILTFLTGRYGAGGGGPLGFFVIGGVGAITYDVGLDGWNSDVGLRAGTGIEYRWSPKGALFLEWGRLWGYHEKEGVTGGRVNHSQLKLGTRFGF